MDEIGLPSSLIIFTIQAGVSDSDGKAAEGY